MFTPRYLKDGKALVRATERIINYRKDIVPPDRVAEAEEKKKSLQNALRSRSAAAVGSAEKPLLAALQKLDPPRPSATIREYVELVVVVLAIAIGLRTYYLQPFKIPTGSMQPTLNGVIATRTEEPPPNPVARLVDFLLFGRSYENVVAEVDNDYVAGIRNEKVNFLWDGARIYMHSGRQYVVGMDRSVLMPSSAASQQRGFGLVPSDTFYSDRSVRRYRKGEPIVRGYAALGDQIFVDRFSYNFISPRRADIFVFKTNGIIMAGEQPEDGSGQHFIKRLAGIPGDMLQIKSPELWINGKPAESYAFQRVASGANGYTGYTNRAQYDSSMRYLTAPDDTYKVMPDTYFALGDNSANSSDSRYWGQVPRANVVGRGFLVYWPLGSHVGFPR